MSQPNAQDDDSRRTRVYVACLNCRKRKTKCMTDATADKPCTRCVKHGLQCTYAPIDHDNGVSASGQSSSQQSTAPHSNPFALAPTSSQQHSGQYGGGPSHGYASQQQQPYGTQSYQHQLSYGSQSAPPYLQKVYTSQQGLYDQGFAHAGYHYNAGGNPGMYAMAAQGYQRYAGTDPALALQEDALTEGDISLPAEAGPPAEAALDA
ncbi:hypothetical protein C8F01DRAFT_1379474 [Mycena amicta]|nr:hypothetical protein C8F01DRAFT_1379474 [Mycena amicta]